MKGYSWIPVAVLTMVTQPVWADPVQVGQVPVHQQTIQVIRDVQIKTTEQGIQIGIQTQSGSAPRFLAPSLNYRTVLVVDLLDARLETGSFSQANPAPGILSVRLDRRTDTSVRLTIIGDQQLPLVTVQAVDPGVVVSLASSDPVAVDPPPTPDSTPGATKPVPTPTPAIETPDLELEEITVVGERSDSYTRSNASTATRTQTPLRDIPQSIQVVPQSVLQDQRVSRVSEALRNVSGVQVDDSFGGTLDRINIRGFQADVFLENGFRRSSFGGRGISDTELIERVEVLKGPASVLYGNIEPGGVINIVTKRPQELNFKALSLSGGSFGLFKPSFDLTGSLNESGALLYRLNGLYEYNDGYRDYAQDVNRFVLSPSITWQIGDRTTLDAQLYYSSERRPFDRGIPAIGNGIPDVPYNRRFQNDDALATTDEFSISYQLKHQFSQDWTLNHEFRYLSVDTFDFRIDNWIIDDSGILDRRWRSNDDYRESYFLGANIVGNFITGSVKHTLLAGVDWSQLAQGGTQRRLPDDPSFFINIFTLEGDPITKPSLSEMTNVVRDNLDKETLVGIFLQDQISFTDNFKMLAGVRLDFYETENIFNGSASNVNATELSPRVGLLYQPTPEISLYTSYSQAFTPNIFDLTASGDPIDPEISKQIEFGVRGEFLDSKLIANLAAYNLVKQNVAAVDPDNPDFAIPVGEITSEGIELDIAGEITPGWNIIASYAYTDAAVSKDTSFYPAGNRPDNVAENTASLWTNYTFQEGDWQGFGFGLGIFSVGERFGDFENTYRIPGYVQTDAALFYGGETWKAALNFKNLFDTRYIRYSEGFRESNTPGDPFTVVGSFSMEF